MVEERGVVIMTISYSPPPPAGYCVRCHKGYAVGPHVCPDGVAEPGGIPPAFQKWHDEMTATQPKRESIHGQ